MTISELQKRLYEMYRNHGDIEVVMEDTDWTSIEKYHTEIFKVKEIKNNGNVAVALANN